MRINKAAVNRKFFFINFCVKCVNRKLEHPAPSKWCCNSPLMQLLFNWTWLYREALPVTLCYWWYLFQQTEDTSTVQWIVCATHAALTVKEGMKSIGCRSVKCLHASPLNLAPPAIKTSTCTCLWGFWGSGFPKCSGKCWMHLHHQANTEANLFMHHLQCNFSSDLDICGKTWYLSTVSISLILCHEGQILPQTFCIITTSCKSIQVQEKMILGKHKKQN